MKELTTVDHKAGEREEQKEGRMGESPQNWERSSEVQPSPAQGPEVAIAGGSGLTLQERNRSTHFQGEVLQEGAKWPGGDTQRVDNAHAGEMGTWKDLSDSFKVTWYIGGGAAICCRDCMTQASMSPRRLLLNCPCLHSPAPSGWPALAPALSAGLGV
nr:uncharacterized protein LOC105876002 [Microcebus murinus]